MQYKRNQKTTYTALGWLHYIKLYK